MSRKKRFVSAVLTFLLLFRFFVLPCAAEVKVYRSVETVKKQIALTFDDGPNGTMLTMVDSFKEYNGKCTFFPIGSKINQGQAVYLNYALENGFQIGSHSNTHTAFTTYTTKEELLKEFNDFNTALYDVCEINATCLRLPGGSGNEFIYETFKEAEIPLIHGIGIGDWDGSSKNTQDIIESVLKTAADGRILVMHSTEKTALALKTILPELEKQGYEFVTVAELFNRKGYLEIPLGYQVEKAEQQ